MLTSPHMNIHYSSERPDWETPQDFFDKLDEEFDFEVDVCATLKNTKCDLYFDELKNGLKQPWRGVCWMNPPYGREIGAWMRKAYESSLMGATIVCLVPARTDTRWWHDFAIKGEIRFIKGRLRFVGAKKQAPFPNAVIIFKGTQIEDGSMERK